MSKVKNEEQMQENKMGTMPVSRLLISMSLPMMISMIVQALYNIVDSIFVSRLSENALTAVSLAFPIQTLMIAVGTGIGVGINALLSRSLGERNQQKANDAATQGIFLIVIGYFLFLFIGLFLAEPFITAQTDNPEILESSVSYLRICCCCSFGIFGQVTYEKLLQSTGKTIYTMITQGTGAIINIILDPIMIFGLFGTPKLGVAGAAAATVIGQCVAALLAVYFHRTRNKEVRESFSHFRPHGEVIKDILGVGIPSIIMQAIGSLMTFCFNLILIGFSPTAVAVFGVYFKLQSFVFMPIFGLNNGLVPIVAYNYGAGNRKRLIKSVKLSVFYAVGIMLIGFLIFQLIPDKLLLLFDASENMLTIGVPALRIICLSFLFAGYCIVIGSMFQALGNGIYSMIVSIARQIFVLIPAAFLFARIGGLSMVWWAFPVAEIMSVAISTYFLFHINKNIISKLK